MRGRGGLHPIEQSPLLRVEGLKKVFRSGEADLVLFENLSFQVNRGEMLAIVDGTESSRAEYPAPAGVSVGLPRISNVPVERSSS